MTLEALLLWSALGLVAGVVAKLVMPGKQGINPITTVLLGIIGSLIGGYLGAKLGFGDMTGSFSIKGIITAVAGAILLMAVWRMLFGKKG
jgi:uncharacterized membrane protein YeaQ/YmgE (transglycosylase-associated protein family)